MNRQRKRIGQTTIYKTLHSTLREHEPHVDQYEVTRKELTN